MYWHKMGISKLRKISLDTIFVSRLKENKTTEVVLKLLSLLLPWLPVSGLEFIDRDNTEKLILLFKQHCPILLHPGYFCSV